MATRTSPPKKVRLACQRCRVRRIKCDGEIPACTNCAKAGEICIDVDNQNPGLLVPRNFATAAKARIQWLEDIIKDRLPDIDLSQGPQISACSDSNTSSIRIEREQEHGDEDGRSPSEPGRPASQSSRQQSLKRPAEATQPHAIEASFPEQAHSIAYNFGMLSLNSDSPQKHYLGSSSGLLFTHLIGATPSSAGSPSVADAGVIDAGGHGEWVREGSAQEASKRHCRSLFFFLRQELPRREDALTLVHTYIRWIHPEYPVLEPSSILSALDALYLCAESPLENEDFSNGWPSHCNGFRWNGRPMPSNDDHGELPPMPVVAFIIFMVFNIAAIVKVRTRTYEYPPERFYRAAVHFSKDAFVQISLPSIQALVTLIIHTMLTPAEAHLWTMVHIALAHCVELGIHREEISTTHEDTAYQQIRRFIFFTIYSLDRSVSSIQGRPLGFRDETFDIKMPETQVSTDFEDMPALGFSSAVTRYAVLQWELDRIISDIKLMFYHLPGTSPWFLQTQNPSSRQIEIRDLLNSWRERASAENFSPTGLDDRQRRIWHLKLKVKYHTTMVMLFQPSQILRNPDEEALQTCYSHASCILQDYQNLHDMYCLHHGWRTVQNIFAAGATLIYSFWTSATVRRNASKTDLSKNLRTCSNLLTIGGEWWPSVKRGQESFGSLADLTIQRLYMDATPFKHPRLTNAHSIHSQRQTSENSRNEMSGPRSAHEQVEFGENASYDAQSAMALSSGQEPWQDTDLPLHESSELFPEIENFLAEFDRSEFIWSFSLNALGNQYGMDNLPDYTGQ